MLDIYYINLDARNDRRSQLLANLSIFNKAQWKIHRISAISSEHVQEAALLGPLTLPEKACFLSHLAAIKSSQQSKEFSLILEDDVQFSKNSTSVIEQTINLMDESIDVVYAEIGFPSAELMVHYFQLKYFLMNKQEFRLIDIPPINYFGATAYILNSLAKEKILKLADGLDQLNLPFDDQLQKWIRTGKLKAKFIFPFPVTLAPDSIISNIRRPTIEHMAINQFRISMGFDYDALRDADEKFELFFDQHHKKELDPFSRILSLLICSNLNLK
ncbi:glycosyltransferase family 25 protein [Polynucleobacter sphagniphilus]|jgi:GR25 family glycosyltransferase involved in LPS biosynthesis|uniref:GR25 family glycosyltransferase involved in LPS biosynthesis n=1 Tax=Polynucleobacter sphagniphilus TaxID=1743169 RepID=A0AA43MBW2_9BURK|nr:glycosyltransferase family 25 protein [Polynucleobacter sphagniphilus]MDH6505024.1 GR25 family glycosyltransferase involved in LPS biosynthesis [Polynucleobacter sphagniphilus]MDH6513664.1 GR25 family glycosyltransferase involved in LPS biosynthesis [Polynucleobacter sphagniphilus]